MDYGEFVARLEDKVFVLPDLNGYGGVMAEVRKIGRKLVTILDPHGNERIFDKVTRREQTRGSSTYCILLTQGEYLAHQRREQALTSLREVTRVFGWESRLSVSKLESLVALLREP